MKKANIVLICTDQQRADTIEAHGNPCIKTPVLNELAGKGVSFTRAYTPCPVCVPARHALLTGQAPHRTKCFANSFYGGDTTSIMQILSDNGYQTHGIGKMHFKNGGINDTEYLWGFGRSETRL